MRPIINGLAVVFVIGTAWSTWKVMSGTSNLEPQTIMIMWTVTIVLVILMTRNVIATEREHAEYKNKALSSENTSQQNEGGYIVVEQDLPQPRSVSASSMNIGRYVIWIVLAIIGGFVALGVILRL